MNRRPNPEMCSDSEDGVGIADGITPKSDGLMGGNAIAQLSPD
jgi:hypothetical protein